MQTSELCKAHFSVVDRAGMTRAASLACGSQKIQQGEIKEVARRFSSFLYSMAFKEMQKTVPRNDSSAVADGVRGLIGTYLPRTLGRDATSPVGRYVREEVFGRFGESINEHV